MQFNHTTKEAFVAAFAFISEKKQPRDHVIEFKEEWHNGTGYFDGLVKENLGLAIGHRFVTQTPGDHTRRIVGVVTPVGNVVFFERYSNKESDVITVNTPSSVSSMIPSGQQEQPVFERAIGAVQGFNTNIGEALRSVVMTVVTNAELLNATKAQSIKSPAEENEI